MGDKYETMAEIEERYDGEWVLIANPTPTRGRLDSVTGGHVVLHTPDRAELDRRLLGASGGPVRDWAVLYIGRMPAEEDEVVEPSEAEAAR